MLGIADALCEAKCVTKALVRSALAALVSMVVLPKKGVDVVSALR